MSIRAKLILLTITSLFGVVCLPAIGLWQMGKVYEEANFCNVNSIPAIRFLTEATNSYMSYRLRVWEHINTKDEGELQRTVAEMGELKKHVYDSLDGYKSTIVDKEDQELLEDEMAAFGAIITMMDKVMELDRAGKDEEAIAMLLKNLDQLKEVAAKFKKHQDYNQTLAKQQSEEAAAAKQFATYEMLVISLIIGVISLVIGLVTSKTISSSISRLMGHILAVEKTKHLKAEPKVEGKDEIGQIGAAFNNFVLEIKKVIQEFAKGASILASASTELSASTVQISKTAEELRDNAESSAAAAQETSSNLQQMSEAVNRINIQIGEIQKAGNQATQLASTGTQAVHEARDSMTAITESSKKIVGITRVIEEIASQTNLLSLNAAIEAAKAGEFGKGFAVVAEEVRNLADRSTKAVAEIKQLIEKSEHDVHAGNQVVLRTSEALDQIITAVQTMAQGINQNARDIAEQDASTKEASLAVEDIAKTSEGNASAITQLAATSTQVSETANDLSRTAESLNDEVQKFRLDA
ncbi:MAG: hypothetical protein A2600_00750 [Candidatus Lambdaproteobacteria bacterium RIFOXYD1_FULL_56_27]|uniref:Chemotaxis protein n=1 Tax=Candidatus Lambdaproteobacteria bacterium RIFOXYD2_FULL_56_26 TaxID=1817773 RepID=A0A1F6GLP7_9PROT|nr:MAG: hypothetical protein A2557_09770 [Candidatus Lambdaproteobacteria bacterium RIFOXYD2_FULL_56_26]OGH01430.1 MAG: hypothetical protein A2426_08555 [Candidatus Lambdaproteobacteria bacterium RIFOXYC1_FULL_56_13]OGH07083.1 MAG: hypothetical protein A2600_00750 [Candidatus Lambdaproteobacteria bacterium RIFOXYD1_FULL_56_27]